MDLSIPYSYNPSKCQNVVKIPVGVVPKQYAWSPEKWNILH